MKKYLKLLFLGISDEHSDEREIEIKYKNGFIAFNLMAYLSLARFWYNIFTKQVNGFDFAFVAILVWYVSILIKNNVLSPNMFSLKQKKRYLIVTSMVGLAIGVTLSLLNGPAELVGGIIGGSVSVAAIYGGSLYFEMKAEKEIEEGEE